jgi:hypothetical protein
MSEECYVSASLKTTSVNFIKKIGHIVAAAKN